MGNVLVREIVSVAWVTYVQARLTEPLFLCHLATP